MIEKFCPQCKETLPVSNFYKTNGDKPYFYICKKCQKKKYEERKDKYNKRRRELNSFDPIFKAKKAKNARAYRVKNPNKQIYYQVKNRAKRKGIEFNLDLEDIIIPDLCPILNIPLYMGTKDDYENTPSLDRIDNKKGYIKGNIMVISKKANSMKNSATFEELNTFCINMLNIIEKYWKK